MPENKRAKGAKSFYLVTAIFVAPFGVLPVLKFAFRVCRSSPTRLLSKAAVGK
jgi:hypothetical protein